MAAEVVLAMVLGVRFAAAEPDTTNQTSTASSSSSAAQGDALAGLFNTLLTTFGAIFLGLVCVRLQVVDTEKGDTKAMGFYTGKIAFPLLIFSTVATANLGDVDMGTVLACNLGKISVMVATAVLAFFTYKPERPAGQQALTSTIFAFFTVASNDFAVGFPVIQAIYGPSMAVYIAANAVVGSFFFVPVTMVAFSLGQTLLKRASLTGGETAPSAGSTALGIVKDLVMNPVITCTVAGMLYKIVFASTLTTTSDGKLQLPSLLHETIKLFTGPFVMSALFLTGTSLKSAKLALWPAILVIMKVVVCAFLSYLFSELLSGGEALAKKRLTNFSFFYGSIPTSSAPLVFASQFDPGAAELISTSVLLGLVLAGPIMFLTALMLERGACIRTLGVTQLSTIGASLACGAVYLLLIAAMKREWGYSCPAKKLLAFYGFALIAYEGLAFFFNPALEGNSLCRDYNMHSWSVSATALSWLQNSTRLMALALQFILVFGPARSRKAPGKGTAMVAACCVVAMLAAMIAGPNTVDQICHRDLQMGQDFRLVSGFVWTCLLLFSSMVLWVMSIRKQYKAGQAEEEAEEESSSGESDADETKTAEPGAGMESEWVHDVPKDVIMPLAVIFTLTLVTQFVNTSSVFLSLGGSGPGGSFLVMLILETVLVHGSVLYLLIALLMSTTYARHLTESIPRLCPCLGYGLLLAKADQVLAAVPDGMLGSSSFMHGAAMTVRESLGSGLESESSSD